MNDHGPGTKSAHETEMARRRRPRRPHLAAALGAVAVVASAIVLVTHRSVPETPRNVALRPLQLANERLVLVPESERPFRRVVIGLTANQTRYFMLPSTQPFDPKSRDPHVRFIRRQSYWLNFELVHGRIMRALPDRTRVFVAVPDPRSVPASVGNEEEVFRDYLQTRVGWSARRIAERVRFFTVPGEIPFPQDLAEVLGTGDRGRLVLSIGGDLADVYREPVMALARAFPEDFVIRTLGPPDGVGAVNIEGGDISLVWLPEGSVGLLIGRHRIRRYVEREHGEVALGTPLPREAIEEARDAFRRAFFGVETIVVGEHGLVEPSLVSEELFHTDMVVNVVRAEGTVLAFVPAYQETPVDAITHVPLADEVRRRVQYEYDLVAVQLSRRGFHVVRLPFADHPNRNPVNVARFVDPDTRQQCVILGKYPYHFPLVPGGPIAQFELQDTFDVLDAAVGSWRRSPTDGSWLAVEQAFRDAWTAMDKAAESTNPVFDLQRRAYSAHGIRVIPVAIYPTGEGGLHCLSMN